MTKHPPKDRSKGKAGKNNDTSTTATASTSSSFDRTTKRNNEAKDFWMRNEELKEAFETTWKVLDGIEDLDDNMKKKLMDYALTKDGRVSESSTKKGSGASGTSEDEATSSSSWNILESTTIDEQMTQSDFIQTKLQDLSLEEADEGRPSQPQAESSPSKKMDEGGSSKASNTANRVVGHNMSVRARLARQKLPV